MPGPPGIFFAVSRAGGAFWQNNGAHAGAERAAGNNER